MKISNTSERLNQVMKERNLRQIDIIRLAEPYCKFYKQKLGRNDLSQFVNGKVNPGQWKLTILGLALNVSESWLMGYDVPMERSPNSNTLYQTLTPHEDKVITAYRNKPAAQPKVDKLLDIESETDPTLIPLFPDPKSPINYWDDQHVSSLKLADDSFSLGSLAEPSSDDDKSQPHE